MVAVLFILWFDVDHTLTSRLMFIRQAMIDEFDLDQDGEINLEVSETSLAIFQVAHILRFLPGIHRHHDRRRIITSILFYRLAHTLRFISGVSPPDHDNLFVHHLTI